MNLLQQIDSHLKEAMKSRDTATLGVLRLLKSALKYAAIESGDRATEPDDDAVLKIIRKEIKKREDSVAEYTKANRKELADKEQKEIDILSSYLPPSLSAQEVEQLVKEAIAEVGATGKAQMGLVMKAVAAKAEGRTDGRTLSSEVQRQLSALS